MLRGCPGDASAGPFRRGSHPRLSGRRRQGVSRPSGQIAQQRRPANGAPPRKTRHARLPSVHLHSAGQVVRREQVQSSSLVLPAISVLPTSARLPRLVARGYLSCRARTSSGSVTPFYDELACLETPLRDQFVISIDWPVLMRLPALSDGLAEGGPRAKPSTGQPRAAAAARRPGRDSPRAGDPPPRAWADPSPSRCGEAVRHGYPCRPRSGAWPLGWKHREEGTAAAQTDPGHVATPADGGRAGVALRSGSGGVELGRVSKKSPLPSVLPSSSARYTICCLIADSSVERESTPDAGFFDPARDDHRQIEHAGLRCPLLR